LKDEFDPIKSWYCQCKTGAHTVGCCAHIASVLWHLGHYRHLQVKPQFNSDTWLEHELDAMNWSESDDTLDDSDSSNES